LLSALRADHAQLNSTSQTKFCHEPVTRRTAVHRHVRSDELNNVIILSPESLSEHLNKKSRRSGGWLQARNPDCGYASGYGLTHS
jgi:hypothetical protein